MRDSKSWIYAMARLLPILAVTIIILASCASTKSPNRVVRLAVLDGTTEYEVSPKGEQLDEGWWLGARDRYISPNPGVLLGESFADEFAKLPGVEVYSREDQAIYMAQKERLISRAYPDLDGLQRKYLLLRQDPSDFGRSLNVDYILRSNVVRASTVTNRTFSWWYSTMHVEIELWDVSKGQLVQRWTWKDSDNFDSQLALAEECAREIRKKARRADVFSLYGP